MSTKTKHIIPLNGDKYMKMLCRNDMINAGGYDGRFSTKVIKDKRKEQNKTFCRQRSILDY